MRAIVFYFVILFFSSSLMANALSNNKTNAVPDVIVTQSPVAGYTQNSRAVLPVQVITGQQIKASGAQNVVQALQGEGIQVNTLAGTNGAQISLRGFGDNAAQNVLVLVNGMPLRQPDIGAINIDQIPIQNVSRIEVWNGGAGVQYGDQAVGGLVNIITSKLLENTRFIEGQLGNQDGRSIMAGATQRFHDHIGAGLNMEHLQTDNYRDHNAQKNNYVNGNVDANWKNGEWQLHDFIDQQWSQFPGALTIQQVHENPKQTQRPFDQDFGQSLNQLLQSQFTQAINESNDFTMPLVLSSLNGNGRLSQYDFTQGRHEANVSPSLKSQFNLKSFHEVNHLNIEGDYATYHLNYPGIYQATAKQTQWGVADVLDTTLSWRWHLLTGYRYQAAFNPHENTAQAYDLSLSYQVKPALRWFLRDNQVFRFPKVDEDVDTVTGKPLKTQTGQSYETGITWKTPEFMGMVSLYQLNLKNEINTVPIFIAAETWVANDNLPPTQRRGVIVNNTWNINDHWSWAVLYQYVHAEFDEGEFKGNAIPFVPSQNVATHFIYRLNSHWQAYVEGIYSGSKTLADDVSMRSPMLGGYTIYNANINFAYRKLKLALRLQNITNKLYFDYALSVYNGSQTTNYYYPSNGRTLWLTLDYSL